MSKLESYGVTDKVLKWVEDFLVDRMQQVTVGGAQSNWTKVTNGVHPGISGPVFSILYMYINDLKM